MKQAGYRFSILAILSIFIRISSSLAEPTDCCKTKNVSLQLSLEKMLAETNLLQAAQNGYLTIALFDLTIANKPRFAGINENKMIYAASLPKIAILLGLFRRLEDKSLRWSPKLFSLARNMISISSNFAATELFYIVGPSYLAKLLVSLKLYDMNNDGGLWVGKEYGQESAWRRDPLHDMSHGASASTVARLYYLLDQGKLLSPVYTHMIKGILSESWLDAKFLAGTKKTCPGKINILRKSGSFRNFHSDSILVDNSHAGGRKFILVGLAQGELGDGWLEDIAGKIEIILDK